jgi:hypothetical protein
MSSGNGSGNDSGSCGREAPLAPLAHSLLCLDTMISQRQTRDVNVSGGPHHFVQQSAHLLSCCLSLLQPRRPHTRTLILIMCVSRLCPWPPTVPCVRVLILAGFLSDTQCICEERAFKYSDCQSQPADLRSDGAARKHSFCRDERMAKLVHRFSSL